LIAGLRRGVKQKAPGDHLGAFFIYDLTQKAANLRSIQPMTDNPEELKARTEEKKQEAEQSIKRQRSEILTPKVVLGLLNFDLGLIAAIVAFGSFAYYSHYFITAKVAFYLSILLFLTVPVGFTWYWRTLFPRKPTEMGTIGQRLLNKIKQSSVSRSLARLGNNRWVRIFNVSYYAVIIILSIRSFPVHPRFSLAIVVIYLAFSLVFCVFWVVETLEREINRRINGILDVLESELEMVDYARKLGEGSLKYITDTEPSRVEAEQARMTALVRTNESLNAIWEFVRKYIRVESDENEPTNTDGK
jgi:hypothetical protein